MAEAGWTGLSILGLDVSAAFMASPIVEHVVLLLPNSYTWDDGTRVYLYCYKAINGLRSSGKAWVLQLGEIAQKAKLKAGRVETTLFSGYLMGGNSWVQIVSYVDDLLNFAESLKVCQRDFDYFSSKLKIKETGRIGGAHEGGGSIKVLGRKLRRRPSCPLIEIAVPPYYLHSCFINFTFNFQRH